MLNGLSLFTGIGGIDLALAPWVRPVAYCEIERYAAAVLFSRMSDGTLPTAPIFPDVTKLTGKILPSIDIIYGGFPCQDISNAGHKLGLAGERSGLFFEIIRLASETRPSLIFLENVAAITIRGLERVLSELVALGYDCRWTILSAAAVGAPIIRERFWLLAFANGDRRVSGLLPCNTREKGKRRRSTKWSKDRELLEVASTDDSVFTRKWNAPPEPERMANGIPYHVERLSGLGNAVCPSQAREAFKILMGI